MVSFVEIAADPSILVPFPPNLYQPLSMLLTPVFRVSDLEVGIAQVLANRIWLHPVHDDSRYPRLTFVIVLGCLPDRVDGEVMVTLH